MFIILHGKDGWVVTNFTKKTEVSNIVQENVRIFPTSTYVTNPHIWKAGIEQNQHI